MHNDNSRLQILGALTPLPRCIFAVSSPKKQLKFYSKFNENYQNRKGSIFTIDLSASWPPYYIHGSRINRNTYHPNLHLHGAFIDWSPAYLPHPSANPYKGLQPGPQPQNSGDFMVKSTGAPFFVASTFLWRPLLGVVNRSQHKTSRLIAPPRP